MHTRFLRRRYIVDWKLQGSLCAHGLLYGGMVLVAVCGGIFLPLLWDLGDGVVDPHLEEQAIVMIYMHERFWVLALLCACIVMLGAIKFSHRIAGPLVRYKRNLRLMADGRLPTPLRTRKSDYLKEEVACLNAAVAGITARVEAIRKAQLAVRHEVLAVVARADQPAAGAFDALTAASSDLEHAVAAFRMHDPGDDRRLAAEPVPQLALAGAGAGGR